MLLNLLTDSSEPASQSLAFQATRSILCENTFLLTISLSNISFCSCWRSIGYPQIAQIQLIVAFSAPNMKTTYRSVSGDLSGFDIFIFHGKSYFV